MIVHRGIPQGSQEWLRLRIGIPTASAFDRIVTPKGEPSKSAEDYCNELLAERMLGRPLETTAFPWMERGHNLEAEARAYYEMERGLDVEEVTFCTTDDGRCGCSPDGLVGDEGLLELKCPKAAVHVSYLLSASRTVDRKYFPQCQGQLFVTGRAWVDIVSYFPGLPEAIVRVERDEKFIALLADRLAEFYLTFDARRAVLKDRGWIPEPEPEAQKTEYGADWLGITDDDIEFLLSRRKAQEALASQ